MRETKQIPRVAIIIFIIALVALLLIGITSAVLHLGSSPVITLGSGIPAPEAELTARQQINPSQAAVGETVMVTVMLTYNGANSTQAIVTPNPPPGTVSDYSGSFSTYLHPGVTEPIHYSIRAEQRGTYLIGSQIAYANDGTWRKLLIETPFIAIAQTVTHSDEISASERSSIIEKIKPAIVTVFAYLENGTYSQGSGFFVTPEGDVITCFHVVENSSRIAIKTIDDQVYQVKKIVAENADADLVRLSVEIPQSAVQVMPINYELPNQGDDIYVMGSPEGLEYSLSKGIISNIRNSSMMQIDAPISPGSSGSPVIKMNGKLIGIVVSTYKGGQNLNFAISSGRIKESMHL